MTEQFIVIGSTRIKKSNIKNFGVNTKTVDGSGPIGAIVAFCSGKSFTDSVSDGFLPKKIKYLYITTYQNDNYTFTEKEININNTLKELEKM